MQVNCYSTAITEVNVYELVNRAEKIAIHYNVVWEGGGSKLWLSWGIRNKEGPRALPNCEF